MENNVISKIKDFIVTKLSTDERLALEGLVPTEEKPVEKVEEKPEIKMKEVKTVDGLIFAHEGDLVVGTVVMDITSGTATPVMDGEYTMEDGSTVTIASGVVSEIASKVEEVLETKAPEVPEVQTQMSAMQVSLESQISSLKKQVVLLNKVVNEILNTPIQNETKVTKNWDELSSLEKFRLTK